MPLEQELATLERERERLEREHRGRPEPQRPILAPRAQFAA